MLRAELKTKKRDLINFGEENHSCLALLSDPTSLGTSHPLAQQLLSQLAASISGAIESGSIAWAHLREAAVAAATQAEASGRRRIGRAPQR